MTENNEGQAEQAPGTITLTQEEISSAQQTEQAALTEATNAHLQQRVVTLRALVNRLQSDLEEANFKLEAFAVLEEKNTEESEPTV